MSLIRSSNGLGNLKLLHKCDLVIYTEGGHNNFRYSEIISGSGTESSDDVEFWGAIFSSVLPNKKIKIIGTIIGIVLFVILIAGFTFAWFTWESSS